MTIELEELKRLAWGGKGSGNGQPPCGKPNFVQRAAIQVLGKIASWTGKTVWFGAGISGGVGFFMGASGTLSRQLVVSPNGQAALITTAGTNAAPFVGPTVGVGFVGGIQFSFSNAQSPQQLAGPSIDAGLAVADVLGAGLDSSVGSGGLQTGLQNTLTLGGGLSYGGPFGGAFIFQNTSVQLVCHKDESSDAPEK